MPVVSDNISRSHDASPRTNMPSPSPGAVRSRGQAAVRSRGRTVSEYERLVGFVPLGYAVVARVVECRIAALRPCHVITGGACTAVTQGSNKHRLLEGKGNNSYILGWFVGLVSWMEYVLKLLAVNSDLHHGTMYSSDEGIPIELPSSSACSER
jgi:hypothetical protein